MEPNEMSQQGKALKKTSSERGTGRKETMALIKKCCKDMIT